MPELPVVEPLQPQAAAPAEVQPVQPPPPEAPQEPQGEPAPLPPELLSIPAFQGLMAGTPAALSVNIKGSEDRDEMNLLGENKEALMAAGMGFYRSISGQFGVVFNALRISPKDIQAADKAGKLRTIAPDFDDVNHQLSKSGKDNPALTAQPAAGLASSVSAQAPPQSASGMMPAPAPASVARKLAAQRVMNMQAGAPTTGPSPGAGRLLNSVLKTPM